MRIEIFSSRSLFRKLWYWRIRHDNGEILVSSEGHKNKGDVVDTALHVRAAFSMPDPVEIRLLP